MSDLRHVKDPWIDMEVAISGKISSYFLPTQFHLSLLRSLASSWKYLAVNVGMSKQAGGDRVSAISQPGCSTSVVLATGPTDEEGEELHYYTREGIKGLIKPLQCWSVSVGKKLNISLFFLWYNNITVSGWTVMWRTGHFFTSSFTLL